MRVTGPILGLLLLLAIVGPARAEDEPGAKAPAPPAALEQLEASDAEQVEIVRELLGSSEPRLVAWGAYEAGRRTLVALTPELLRLARELPQARDLPSSGHALRTVRAALVDLDAVVPQDLLSAMVRAGGFAEETAAILAIGHATPQELLALFQLSEPRHAPGPAQLALGNELARVRPAGFALCMLLALRFDLHVFVHDDERRSGLGGATGSVAGDGRLEVPAGWPPVVMHRLRTRPGRGAHVLATGPRTVYVWRSEHTERSVGFGSVLGSYTRQAACRDWLASLFERVPGSAFTPDTVRVANVPRERNVANVRWTTAEAYVPALRLAYERVHTRFHAFMGRLIERGVLTRDEAARVVPQVRVHVHDERQDRSSRPALPDVPFTTPKNPFADEAR